MVGISRLATSLLAVDIAPSLLVAISHGLSDRTLLHLAWADSPLQALDVVASHYPTLAVFGSAGRGGGDDWARLALTLLRQPGVFLVVQRPDLQAERPEWAADPRVIACPPERLAACVLAALDRAQGDGWVGTDGSAAPNRNVAEILDRLFGVHASLPVELDRARHLESVAREVRSALRAEAVSLSIVGSSIRVTDPPRRRLPEMLPPLEALACETGVVITHSAVAANHLMCLPLVAGGGVLGSLSVLAPAAALCAKPVMYGLYALAAAISARLEQARSRREQDLALQDMRAVADSARRVVAGLGIEQVLHGTLRAAMRHVPAASAGVAFLTDGTALPGPLTAQTGDPAVCAAIDDCVRNDRIAPDGAAGAPALVTINEPGLGASLLAVAPLIAGSETIGSLVLAPAADSTLSARDLRVLATIADQGALAIENARLQGQAQQADEIAALYRLGQALNSTLDLRETVSTTLDTARSLTGATAAELRLAATDGMSLESVAGLDEPTDASPGDRYRMSVLYPQLILASRHPLLVPDVIGSSPADDFTEREPVAWLGAYLGVPLLAGERVIGVLSLGSRRRDAFSAEDLRLLEIVASQAAIALSNARLYQETTRSLREAEAVAAVSRSVASSLDQHAVLQAVTSALVAAMPRARYAFSYLVGPSGTPSISALAPTEAASLDEPDAGIWQWCADGCLVRGEPVVLDDTLSLGFPSHSVGTAHSVVAVPMVAAGKTVGVIGVDSVIPNAFHSGDLRLIQTMADQAATAVESATLYRDLEAAYQDLRQSSQTLSAVFNGITDGMYIVAHDRSIVALNEPEARFLGLRPEALVGEPYRADRHRSEGNAEHAAVLEALERGTHVSTIVSYLDRGIDPVWREIDAYPIHDEEGETRSVVVFARNVTARRRLEATLAESSRMASVGQLASSIAHEVNNPLTVIIGNAEILLLDTPPDDPTTDSLAMILRAANRAARTIQSLLDLSSQTDEELSEVEVGETVVGALELLGHPLRKAGIELVTRLSADLPAVTGSPNHLTTVWMGLILNARDAVLAAEGGARRIVIQSGLSEDGSEVYVSVADTGVGIEPSQREQLFQPFYTTKPVGEALGLGLYSAYSVVRDHGGHIDVESLPGHGATFTVYLPVDQSALGVEAAGPNS